MPQCLNSVATNEDTPASSPCIFEGISFSLGQSWNIGCNYTCDCNDVNTGEYNCYSRCPIYSNIPSQCTLIQDPYDSCCQTVKCVSSGPAKTKTPVTSPKKTTTTEMTTTSPILCVYNGAVYNDGDTWQDGCSKSCTCQTGWADCFDICFFTYPSGCRQPNDPIDYCCNVPDCAVTPTQSIVSYSHTLPNPQTTKSKTIQPTFTSGTVQGPTAMPYFPLFSVASLKQSTKHTLATYYQSSKLSTMTSNTSIKLLTTMSTRNPNNPSTKATTTSQSLTKSIVGSSIPPTVKRNTQGMMNMKSTANQRISHRTLTTRDYTTNAKNQPLGAHEDTCVCPNTSKGANIGGSTFPWWIVVLICTVFFLNSACLTVCLYERLKRKVKHERGQSQVEPFRKASVDLSIGYV